jgi:Flp pilus assembly protein TadD
MAAALSYLAAGEGAMAVAELRALRDEGLLGATDAHYYLGIAHLLAFDWPAAAAELRRFLSDQGSGWRAGWAYLHLGRAYQQAGRTDEASLAFRGCLAVEGAERATRKLAFELMSRLASSMPIGYGQAPTRPATR